MSMEYLWTPWRMAYISGDGGGEFAVDKASTEEADQPENDPLLKMESTDCVFCDRLRMPEQYDRKNLILLRAKHNFVILNLYPYNSGHLMVVPSRHTADFASMDAETVNEMTALAQRLLRTIEAEYKPQGFNLGMNLGRVAGAGVADHVHMHVVPRWAGDSNFMPIVGATKVMPELLETTYDRLKKRLEATE